MRYFCKLSIGLMLMALFAGIPPVTGQSGSLIGKIIDEKTGKEVDYGLVLNYSKHISIYSNITGEFVLQANPGDTLVFSAIGYYYMKVIVTDSLLKASVPIKFVISPQAYEIREAHIFALGTYSEFKQKFINLNEPKSKTRILAEELADMARSTAKDAFYNAQANRKLDGITFISIPIRTPEEKERIALAAIIKNEKIRDRIYQKFNPEVIKKVTGLKEDNDIIEFMIFCEFSTEYLIEINEYDLMAQIALKFEAFKRKQQIKNSGDFPVNLNHGIYNPNT
jgi:hypothetical protein